MKVNVMTICSGYDSQCLALNRLKTEYSDFDYELVAWAEFDPESKKNIDDQPAVKAHNALFPESIGRNIGDITKADWASIQEPIDLLFYSTPCQSISAAGKRGGFSEGSGTKSSIIWSVLNAIETLKPKYLIMENVATITSGSNKTDLDRWMKSVKDLGYNSYCDILNAKDFGVPQNRKRFFMISVRQDIEEQYVFPNPNNRRGGVEAILEDSVPDKYYYRKSNESDRTPLLLNGTEGLSRTIKAQYHKNNLANFLNARSHSASAVIEVPNRCIQVGNIYAGSDKFQNRTAGRIYSTAGLSPALRTQSGGGNIPHIEEGSAIRRFTPRECFRLMGVDEYSIDRLLNIGLSDTQLYRLAGNSIVVDVLYYILYNLYINKYNSQTLF